MKRPPLKILVPASAVAVGFLLVVTGVVPTPNVEEAMLDAGRALGRWTYLLVGALAFLETGAFVGLVAPGESAVLAGGVVAAQGHIDPVVLVGVVWSCAMAGDVTSYLLGRRLGRGFLERHGQRVRVTPERLEHVEGFFDRYGGATILIGRFIGLVRALAPFLAGASRMPLRRFLPYDVVGAGLWSGLFVGLGYVFWASLGTVTKYVGRGLFALGAAVGLVVLGLLAHRLARDPRRRARAMRNPWLRRLVGPARFLDDRLTPGELGLELTTLVAIAAAGGYATVAIGLQVDEHPLLPGDDAAFDIVEALRTGTGIDIVKVLTEIGSLPVAGLAVIATAVWAWRRGRRPEAIAISAGMTVLVALVTLSKLGWERPRPLDGHVAVEGLSYPSGHAAYGVALIACAVVLVRAGSSLAVRFAGVGVAIALAAVVGLSRVYLRAHFLSDVLGGVALALSVLAASGVVALVVSRS